MAPVAAEVKGPDGKVRAAVLREERPEEEPLPVCARTVDALLMLAAGEYQSAMVREGKPSATHSFMWWRGVVAGIEHHLRSVGEDPALIKAAILLGRETYRAWKAALPGTFRNEITEFGERLGP